LSHDLVERELVRVEEGSEPPPASLGLVYGSRQFLTSKTVGISPGTVSVEGKPQMEYTEEVERSLKTSAPNPDLALGKN
jgi:hypothetical protein